MTKRMSANLIAADASERSSACDEGRGQVTASALKYLLEAL